MAYNPFNIFRRNQKAIFAVLTVFIMIMFTLSSGVVGGDFFETFTQWLGSKGKRGEPVCTIDGTKIYDSELQKLQVNRRMASQYMTLLALTTAQRLDQAVKDQLGRLSPQAVGIISQIIDLEQGRPRDAFEATQLQFRLQQLRMALQQLAESPTATPDDKEVARTMVGKFILRESVGPGGQYAGFASNQTLRDRIDFLLWQKKADQLGIRFTPEDVGKLIRREVYGQLTDEVQTAVQNRLREEMQNFNMATCLKALGEEFRVRAAQVAILGPRMHGRRVDKTDGDFPMYPTPFEAFDYYRDACSPTSYAAIPVPALNLLAEVERRMQLPSGDRARIAGPTENELRDLFDKHKDTMFSPDKDTPGFKIPPRIRLEFFQITGEEPYYKAEAEKALKNELLQTNLLSAMTAHAFGTPPGLVAYNAKSFIDDPLLTRRYADTVRKHHEDQASRYSNSDVDFRSGQLARPLMESSVVRSGTPAITAGGMGGQLAALGNPLAGLGMVVGGPMAYEIRDRVRVGMPAVLGMVPVPGMFNAAIGGAAASHAMLPKPLSIEAYRSGFMQTLTAEKAKEIAFGSARFGGGTTGDVETFIQEVSKLSEQGRARDMAAAKKYIAEFVAKRGLTIAGDKEPRTEWNLEDDPDLAPLVAAQKEALFDPSSPHRSDYTPFGRSFFWDDDFFTRVSRPVSGTYVPKEYPPQIRFSSPSGKSRFLVWRTEEIAATALNWDDATMATVKNEWKRMKARELAKEKADAIAEVIRKSGKTSVDDLVPFLRDESEKLRVAAPTDDKSQRRAMPFPIRGVCPLTSQTGNPADGTGLLSLWVPDRLVGPSPVQRFALAPSENIKYPTAEFQNTILDDRTKPPGTVLVLADAPKDTYYVVTLVKRDEKTENDYLTQVGNGRLSDAFGGRTIMAEFQNDALRKAFLSINALLKIEFKYDETDEQKKKLDEDDKRGGNDN